MGEKVMWWMNGPHFVDGKTTWIKYKIESSKNNKRKFTEYTYRKCMILNRFQDEAGRWYIVVHPMPQKSDIKKHSQLINIKSLRIRSEGTVYKAYVNNNDDDKHYVINVEKLKCRCIEDQTVYKIRRKIKKRTTKELWKEILIQAQSDADNADIPWKRKKKEPIQPLNKLDPTKFIGKCGFIDLSMDNIQDEEDENDSKNETNYDEMKQHKKHTKILKISEIDFPEIGQKVIGRVVKIVRHGMFVDIGYKKNGKGILGFLHISQIKIPAAIIKERLSEYLQSKQDRLREEEEYELYLKREAKKKKKKRRKNKNNPN